MNQGEIPEAGTRLLTCLYCRTATFEMGQGSKEHAILSSLGGRKSCRNVCCVSCNNQLGDEVDAPMARNFAFITTNIGIVTGRNKPAATLQRFVEIDGHPMDLIAGGEFKLSKGTVRIEPLPDGNFDVVVNARSVEEAYALREQVLQKFKKERYRIESAEMTRIFTPVPTMRGRVAHGHQEQCRAAAKMALAYLATMVDPQRLRDEIFQPVVNFIRGVGELPAGICGIEQIELGAPLITSPFVHSLLVVADPGSGYVLALLRLYDTFGYTIRLAEGWHGPAVGRLYCMDPVTGQSEEEDVNVEAAIRTYRVEAEFDPEVFNAGLTHLLDAIADSQREKLIGRAIEEVIGAQDPPNATLTDEGVREVVDKILERLLPNLLQLPHRQQLPIDPKSVSESTPAAPVSLADFLAPLPKGDG